MFNLKKLVHWFFEWLCFNECGSKIVKIEGINQFLIDRKGRRITVCPIWDYIRIKTLGLRISGYTYFKEKFTAWNHKRKYPNDWVDSDGGRHRSICLCCGKRHCPKGGTF